MTDLNPYWKRPKTPDPTATLTAKPADPPDRSYWPRIGDVPFGDVAERERLMREAVGEGVSLRVDRSPRFRAGFDPAFNCWRVWDRKIGAGRPMDTFGQAEWEAARLNAADGAEDGSIEKGKCHG